MVVVKCPRSGCMYQTSDEEPLVVAALLNLHASEHTEASAKTNGPKLERPRIAAGVSQEVWNAFIRKWEAYRIGSRIAEDIAAIQLFQCAESGLADIILKSD